MLSILSIKYALCIETLWNYYVSFVDLKYLPCNLLEITGIQLLGN